MYNSKVDYEQQKTNKFRSDRLLDIVKHGLESLEFNIHHTWMKGLEKNLQNYVEFLLEIGRF
jgi:hypothetical protein